MNSLEVYDAMAESIQAIVNTVQAALERTPPELVADIIDQGIVMAGGGALLPGLDMLLREETGLPVAVAEEPLFSCGAGCQSSAGGYRSLRENLSVNAPQRLSYHWAYHLLELPQRREVLVGKHQSAAAGFDNDMRGA